MGNSWQYRYDTGWIACNDWTNQYLGTTLGGNVNHMLNAPLSNLLVQVFLSTDGTDANSWLLHDAAPGVVGCMIYAVDNNNIGVNTGSGGVYQPSKAGGATALAAQAYYYKVKVWYIG